MSLSLSWAVLPYMCAHAESFKFEVDGKKATGYYTAAKKMVRNGTGEKGKPKGKDKHVTLLLEGKGKTTQQKHSLL
jgi:hypothetical protein